MRNYFINKDNKTGEIVYLEYDKNGYSVSPKAKKKNDIEVNKIVFVSPELTSKLLKKKIDIKINKLLNEYNTIEIDYTNLLRINDNNITKAIVNITYSDINKIISLEE